MTLPVNTKVLNLLKEHSFEIFEERKATVGHTFFDAIRNTLLKEALNQPLCKFLTVKSYKYQIIILKRKLKKS